MTSLPTLPTPPQDLFCYPFHCKVDLQPVKAIPLYFSLSAFLVYHIVAPISDVHALYILKSILVPLDKFQFQLYNVVIIVYIASSNIQYKIPWRC